MTLALHILAPLFGLYLWYLTYVMRETTEGKWVNRIEELWVRIDDRSKVSGSKTKLVFSAVATKVTKILDQVFGVRIISPRVVGVSGSLSFASLFLFFALFFEFGSWLALKYHDVLQRTGKPGITLIHDVPILVVVGVLFFLVSLLCGLLAILPMVFKSQIWAWFSCAPTAFFLYLFLRILYFHLAIPNEFVLIEASALSLVSDVLLLTAIRQSLNWLHRKTTVIAIVSVIVIQICLLAVVVATPLVLLLRLGLHSPNDPLAVLTLLLTVFNFPTTMASLAFTAILVFLLAHRVIWPLLSQWTYTFTRPEVLEKRSIVRSIGATLVIYGLSGIPALHFFLNLFESANK